MCQRKRDYWGWLDCFLLSKFENIVGMVRQDMAIENGDIMEVDSDGEDSGEKDENVVPDYTFSSSRTRRCLPSIWRICRGSCRHLVLVLEQIRGANQLFPQVIPLQGVTKTHNMSRPQGDPDFLRKLSGRHDSGWHFKVELLLSLPLQLAVSNPYPLGYATHSGCAALHSPYVRVLCFSLRILIFVVDYAFNCYQVIGSFTDIPMLIHVNDESRFLHAIVFPA
ncbi:hypothetical protein BDR04DRAFT_616475 [Suillus decipiens]|nr:hypothetical protein BDR04DRAFT_616475 [Suillus decipiens]